MTFGVALFSDAVFVSRQTRMLSDAPSSVKTARELRKYSVPFASSEYWSPGVIAGQSVNPAPSGPRPTVLIRSVETDIPPDSSACFENE